MVDCKIYAVLAGRQADVRCEMCWKTSSMETLGHGIYHIRYRKEK